jgi:hypothetical protein
MKHVVTLTAFASCLALSGAAFAHGVVKASSGGHAYGGAWAEGKDVFAFSKQSVDTTSSSSHSGVRTSTKASSISIGAAEHGSVVVGGEAGAGSSVVVFGH